MAAILAQSGDKSHENERGIYWIRFKPALTVTTDAIRRPHTPVLAPLIGNRVNRMANQDNPDILFLNAMEALHAEAQEIIRCHLAHLNRVDAA
jgi:hypothetical protein